MVRSASKEYQIQSRLTLDLWQELCVFLYSVRALIALVAHYNILSGLDGRLAHSRAEAQHPTPSSLQSERQVALTPYLEHAPLVLPHAVLHLSRLPLLAVQAHRTRQSYCV